MKIPVSLTVNGNRVEAEVEPRTSLADFLRDELRLRGTHIGCEQGVCGACTILIDGAPARSCLAFAAACDGLEVRTIEGFEEDATMATLREAFSREHGLQCGFCTPGMLIQARDIVQRLPGIDERRIRHELSGNLCRCTGYAGIVRAVKDVVAAGPPAIAAASPAPAAKPAVPPRFTPAGPSAPAASVAAAPAATVEESERQGGTRFEESFLVRHPPGIVWAAFADFPAVAACLPGAELTEHDGRSVKGRLRVKLGPIAAAFAGSAVVERDEVAMSGLARGAGSDNASRSRTRGELRYRVAAAGEGASRVTIAVAYDLQGPLAQFSRTGLAQDLGRRLVAEFAANLDARLSPGAAPDAPKAKPALSAGRLLWLALLDRLKALFAR